MSSYFQKIDEFAVRLAKAVIRRRGLVILLAVAITLVAGSGARLLEFSTDYRDFFSKANPELQAFDDLQKTYSKNDSILFVLAPESGDIYAGETLAAVEWLTNEAWQIPYTQRVDSLSNFQHTYGEEDDLIVEDLVENAPALEAARRAEIKNIAASEPLILRQLVNDAHSHTNILVTLNFPQKSASEVPEAVTKARELRAQLEQRFPQIKTNLSGVTMLNNAFSEAGFSDMSSLVPIMFGVILLLTLIIIRSVAATFATFVIIVLSSTFAMGMAGFFGIKLTPISGSAPTIILTLAIADSIHILISLRGFLREGMEKSQAIIEAVRVNLMPVSITSLTTIIGFLALNFSDSPPFWHLGNMTAMGIFAAWMLSLTVLPAMISLLPFHVKKNCREGHSAMNRLADFVIASPKTLIVVLGLIAAVVISFIPRLELNDQWSEYFDESIQFRVDTDKVSEQFGIFPVEFSLPATGSNQISDPEYLHHLDRFANYLREQPNVEHVFSFSDIIKRLNRNLHAEDASYYRIPENSELAAQYVFLYQLSLPYGLDLNDRINIDKSATRVTATLGNISTEETKQFLDSTQTWIKAELPTYMHSTAPTSAQVMFTYIAERNVNNMVAGTIGAILLISIILMFSFMSWRMGLLSLIPNGLPILATFGTWALLFGEVGFSVATVASISLGIIVDDTVHFLSKYVRARNEKGFDAAESVRYAYRNVGVAILVNTVILTAGFLVLTTSSFKVNFDMGLLTSIAICFALLLDFLLLPALLLVLDRDPSKTGEKSMKISKPIAQAAALLLFLVPLLSLADTDPKQMGYDISARSDRTDRGFNDSEVKVTMIKRSPAGEETRTMSFTTLEAENEDVGDKSLIVFSSPRDVEGTALLSHAKILKADDQWLFLPAMKRVKRIASKNKSGPFVSSEFAFEDFTSTELNKYDYLWLREEACGEMNCDVIERKPRYENSGYTRQVAWIDQTDFQVRKIDFYDRRDSLLKSLAFEDYRNYDGVWRSHRMNMVNHTNGKSTELIYSEFSFKNGLSDGDFVKGRLAELR